MPGIRAMEEEAQEEGRPTPIYEDIDLLAFRKPRHTRP